jgi:hypothetical protein
MWGLHNNGTQGEAGLNRGLGYSEGSTRKASACRVITPLSVYIGQKRKRAETLLRYPYAPHQTGTETEDIQN